MSDKFFCCDRLKGAYHIGDSFGLNFRIVKYSEKLYNDLKQIKPTIESKGFLITSGYRDSIDDKETMKMIINYCPFCGKKLDDFYKLDDYVQEIIKG